MSVSGQAGDEGGLEGPSGVGAIVKRGIDLGGGLAGLRVGLPLLACIALAIKLEDGGSIFYVQERLGSRGRPFPLLKFRSMVEGAERMKGGFRIREGDDRITRVGGFLRRFSLDELPQLMNVLRGEMSLVGPRPALVRDLKRYSDRQQERLSMRPGITGLAQVSGRASIPWDTRIEYDLTYIRTWSVTLDLKILLLTVASLLRRERIYPSRDPWADRSERTDAIGSGLGHQEPDGDDG